MNVKMKARIYAVCGEQPRRYAILEGDRGCTVLRMLPAEECFMYYRERRDEVYLDTARKYWLRLCMTENLESAQRFLERIGVDTATEEVSPQDGEARFPIADHQASRLPNIAAGY